MPILENSSRYRTIQISSWVCKVKDVFWQGRSEVLSAICAPLTPTTAKYCRKFLPPDWGWSTRTASLIIETWGMDFKSIYTPWWIQDHGDNCLNVQRPFCSGKLSPIRKAIKSKEVMSASVKYLGRKQVFVQLHSSCAGHVRCHMTAHTTASSGEKKLADFGTSNNFTTLAFTSLINRTK